MNFKRLPNNFGSVTKMSGARRNPYRARKLIGYTYDDAAHTQKAIYKNVGYYATRKEAMEALAKLTQIASVDGALLTFADLHKVWLDTKIDVSDKTLEGYMRGYKLCAPLHKKIFADITASDLEALMDSISIGSRNIVRTTLSQLYKYAKGRKYVSENLMQCLSKTYANKPKIQRKVYTVDEIAELQQQKDKYAKVQLFAIYTGMRLCEILDVEIKNVHIKEGYIICGAKTDAGKNRLVPIHRAIADMVKDLYGEAVESGARYLFSHKGEKLNYRSVITHTKPHYTHDGRHTFATYAHASRMDALAVKRIMGHAVPDITYGTYTHLDIRFLIHEMDKYSPS